MERRFKLKQKSKAVHFFVGEPFCHKCNSKAFLVGGNVIYPHRPDLASKKFWNCPPCKAYVGCHPEPPGNIALGRLADVVLRRLKSEAHAAFDPKWKHGKMTRSEAYGILADRLGIKKKDCHIGWFDEETCKKVIELCKEDWSW